MPELILSFLLCVQEDFKAVSTIWIYFLKVILLVLNEADSSKKKSKKTLAELKKQQMLRQHNQ
jgi:hypothetical protein